MSPPLHNRQGFKIYCGVISVIIVILVIVSVTLVLTVFKFKNPEINAHSVGVQEIHLLLFPKLSINATLDMEVTIENPNYGSFKYENITANVEYHGDTVAKFPLGSQNVPARGQISLRSLVDIMGDQLLLSPYFMGDIRLGSINLTSDCALHGKVIVWNMIKFKATAYITCQISMLLATKTVVSSCKSSLKV